MASIDSATNEIIIAVRATNSPIGAPVPSCVVTLLPFRSRLAKPDPLIYEHLAERFGVMPQQIVYVGDHPAYDVVGSQEAGYQAVWINREQIEWPDHLPEPRHQVVDLHALEALLSD